MTRTLSDLTYLQYFQDNEKLSQEQALPAQSRLANPSLSCASATLLQLLGLRHQIQSQTVTSDLGTSYLSTFEVIAFEVTRSNSLMLLHVSCLLIPLMS